MSSCESSAETGEVEAQAGLWGRILAYAGVALLVAEEGCGSSPGHCAADVEVGGIC